MVGVKLFEMLAGIIVSIEELVITAQESAVVTFIR